MIHQLVALQVEDAVALGRPQSCIPFEDLDLPTPPPLQLVAQGEVNLETVAEALWFRSANTHAGRWIVDDVRSDQVTFRAPSMVGNSVMFDDGEPRDDLRSVTIAEAPHPRRGPGILIQVTMPELQREEALRYRHLGILTQAGRWFGTGLGGLMLWDWNDSLELVYRAFLPLDLLAVLDEDGAIDLIVDAALGAVNIAGIAEGMIDVCASTEDQGIDAMNAAIKEREGSSPIHYRTSALRAATHVRQRDDGLADIDGPLVDVGAALLDRLAVDQMQIHTAPHVVLERGFAWLPGPHVQSVAATPTMPSRRLEVTEVSVVTELGIVGLDDLARTRRLCADMTSSLSLCSLLISDVGEVLLSSRMMVHEEVWWHRSALIAVVAALQLNCATQMQAAFELNDITPDMTSDLRTLLEGDGPRSDFDSIFDVVPQLQLHARIQISAVEDLIAVVESRLLELPGSQTFGELDHEPDVVVVLAGNHPDGGWNPAMGLSLVHLKAVDHEVVGPSVEIEVNPGFLPGNPDLIGEALDLTAATHGAGGLSICPSWKVTGPTISTTVIIPQIALAATWLDGGAAIILQAVNSCIDALAHAVIASADSFPGFDRSQINLTRALGQPLVDLDEEPPTATWAPTERLRVLAFPETAGEFEHWNAVAMTTDASLALIDWLTDPLADESFEPSGAQVLAVRNGSDVTLEVSGRQVAVDESLANIICFQLSNPEGPATRRAQGRVVVAPIGDMIDEDGDTVILVPASAAATGVMSSPEPSCEGISAVTSMSFWLRFRSDDAQFEVEVVTSLGEQMLESADDEGGITFVIAFPQIDGRVAEPPPPSRAYTLTASSMRSAFAEILRLRE